MGSWRKLHNDVFNYLYFSPNIIKVIKLRSMRCVAHVAFTEENIYNILV
jgi:hypothetical protein